MQGCLEAWSVTRVLAVVLKHKVMFLHSALCCIFDPFYYQKQCHKFYVNLQIERTGSTYIPQLVQIVKVVPLLRLICDLLVLYFVQWSPVLLSSTLQRLERIYDCCTGPFPYSGVYQVLELLTWDDPGLISPLFTATLYPELGWKISHFPWY